MGEIDSQGAPDFGRERRLMRRHGGPVAGIDEAGRGPWAGPVVAAAVIFDHCEIPKGICDSKKLTPERRTELYAQIVACARVGVGMAGVARIDRDNILQATLWAMRAAFEALPRRTAVAALVDGDRAPGLPCPCETLITGDCLSLSVAAASIVAKVTRDRLMAELSGDFPGYGWERNMGYGTPGHAAALRELGVTPHHRRSFAPVRAVLDGASASLRRAG